MLEELLSIAERVDYGAEELLLACDVDNAIHDWIRTFNEVNQHALQAVGVLVPDASLELSHSRIGWL